MRKQCVPGVPPPPRTPGYDARLKGDTANALLIPMVDWQTYRKTTQDIYLKVSDPTITLKGSSGVQHSPIVEGHGFTRLKTMIDLQVYKE